MPEKKGAAEAERAEENPRGKFTGFFTAEFGTVSSEKHVDFVLSKSYPIKSKEFPEVW